MKKVKFGTYELGTTGGGYEYNFMIADKDKRIYDAEYYGVVTNEDNYYFVCKTNAVDNNGLKDTFIVRPVVFDIYKNGMGEIFIDQEEQLFSQQMESFLNKLQYKDKIRGISDIIYVCNGVVGYNDNRLFDLLTMDDSFLCSVVSHEIFERKKDLLNSVSSSLLNLQEQQLDNEKNYSK